MILRLLPASTLLILLLALAGCDGGGSSEPARDAAAPPAAGESAPPAPPATEAPPREADSPVVATVNGTPISRQTLDSQVAMADAGRLTFGDEEPRSGEERAAEDLELRLEVLQGLISLELACQEAVRRGYEPRAEEVDEALAALKSDYESPEALSELLKRYGTTEDDLRDQMAKTMALKKWQENDFLAKIKVGDEEVRTFYDAHQEELRHGDLVRVSQIFLAVPLGIVGAEQTTAQAKARARGETALKRLEAGDDFGAVAAEISDDPEAAENRGDMGWLEKGQSLPLFDQAVSTLKPGENSALLETPMGFHILKVTDTRPAGVEPLDEVRTNIAEYLSGEKLETVLREKMIELHRAADVQIFDPQLKAAYEKARPDNGGADTPPAK